MLPLHAVQPEPHALSLLHTTQALLMHCLLDPHELTVHTQLEPLQLGVVPLHAVQLAPQWVASLHGWQMPALHQLPLPHCAFVMHCTQVVPPLHTIELAVQLMHAAPQCRSVLQLRQVPPLHHLLEPQLASTLQF